MRSAVARARKRIMATQRKSTTRKRWNHRGNGVENRKGNTTRAGVGGRKSRCKGMKITNIIREAATQSVFRNVQNQNAPESSSSSRTAVVTGSKAPATTVEEATVKCNQINVLT